MHKQSIQHMARMGVRLPTQYEKAVGRKNAGAGVGFGVRHGTITDLDEVERMVLRMAGDPEYEAEVRRTHTTKQLKKMGITF